MVSTWPAVNPGGTLCKRTKLRTSSPAPTTSISERASSETTSKPRKRCRFKCRPPSLCPLRPPAFSDVLRSTLRARHTGARPNSMPVTSETPNVNATTTPLISMSSTVGIALVGQDGLCLIVNHALCDLLGYDEAWFLVHRLDDLLIPDDAKEPLQDRARALAGSIDKRPVALRLVRADGRTIWVHRVEVLIPAGDGQADTLLVQVEDITAEH